MIFVATTPIFQCDSQNWVAAGLAKECNIVAVSIGEDLSAIVAHYQEIRDLHLRALTQLQFIPSTRGVINPALPES